MQPAPPPALDWCLFLDVDGTLIELSETPFDTRAGADLKSLLQRVSIRLDGALALVSGRRIDYLDQLFAPLCLPASGLHGVERRKASGEIEGASRPDPGLDAARASLAVLVSSHAGLLLEDKGQTVAVHYRMAPQWEPLVRDAVNAIVANLGTHYHVQSGNMMIEIKPLGFTKGGAIKAFMREPPFSGRKPVFLGDDLTDLDGFKAVDDEGGISIAVGDRVTAQYRLDDPAAVRIWLAGIAALGPPRE